MLDVLEFAAGKACVPHACPAALLLMLALPAAWFHVVGGLLIALHAGSPCTRPSSASCCPAACARLQHASLSLLREMLAVLELAERVGNMPDRRAADRLQRRY